MGVVARMTDGLRNVISGLGGQGDKSMGSTFDLRMVSRPEIDACYRGTWLGRKIHDIPALDMTREWRGWQADDEQIEAIEAEEKRLQLRIKVRRAIVLAKLYGGSALIMGLPGNPAKPAPEKIGKGQLAYLHLVHRHQLTLGDEQRDLTKAEFGQPQLFKLSARNDGTGEVEIHPSRVVCFTGAQLPDGSMSAGAEDWFWGDPLLMSVFSALTTHDTGIAAISALMNEAKVDVVKVPGLMDNLTSDKFERDLIERFTIAGLIKSITNTLILDGGDGSAESGEHWEQRQVRWEGLPDVQRTLFQLVSGAADIPATRLLGQSPAGMNATGESDTRNYYDMLSSLQNSDVTPVLAPLDERLIMSATGSRDPAIFYDWRPLWQMSPEEKAKRDKTVAETANTYANMGVVPDDAFAVAVQNRLVEDGVFPGLEAALEEAEQTARLEIPPEDRQPGTPGGPPAPQPGMPDPANDPDPARPGSEQSGSKPKAMAGNSRRRAANDRARRYIRDRAGERDGFFNDGALLLTDKFDPSQPRHGAGSERGGEWSGAGASDVPWTTKDGYERHRIKEGTTYLEYDVFKDGKMVTARYLFTPPGDRGQGNARKLMERLVSAADRHGATVQLRAWDFESDNGRLAKFYASLGFKTVRGTEMVRQPRRRRDAYSPSQPRHPRGSEQGGEWSGGGATETSLSNPPEPGKPFLVFRIASASSGSLEKKNAGNAWGVAEHLTTLGSEDARGRTVHIYEVKTDLPLNPYAGFNSGEPWWAEGLAPGIGFHRHPFAGEAMDVFSFGASGFEARHLGSFPAGGIAEAIDEGNYATQQALLVAAEKALGRRVTKDYDPNQPRDPAGTSTGGRWTGGAGSSVLFEVAPDPDNKELLEKWNALSDEQKDAVTDRLTEQFAPAIASELGVKAEIVDAIGGFEGQVNPSKIMVVSGKPFEVAGVIGDVFDQKAMVVIGTKAAPNLSAVKAINIHIGDANPSTLRALESELGDFAKEGWTYSNGRVQVLNFGDQDNEAYATAIDKRLAGRYVVSHGTINSAYIERKDYVRPQSNRRGTGAGPVADRFRAEFAGAFAKEILGAKGRKADQVGDQFNPNQPRDPAGTRTGGRWTATGAAGADPDLNKIPLHPTVTSTLTPDEVAALKQAITIGTREKILEAMQPAYEAGGELAGTGGNDTLVKNADGSVPDGFWDTRTYRLPDGTTTDFEGAISHLVKDGAKHAGANLRSDRHAIMLIGPPAAGKTTLALQLARRGYALVDADEAKFIIPEYRGGLGSQDVHEESTAMAAIVQQRYSERGTNVILQTVSSGPTSAIRKTEGLHRDRYRVDLVGMEVNPDEAAVRMAKRYLKTGRYVPAEIVRTGPEASMGTYEYLKKGGYVEAYAKVENTHSPATTTESTVEWIEPGKPFAP